MLDWLIANKEWVFSGVGVAALAGLVGLLYRRARSAAPGLEQHAAGGSRNLQAGRDINVSLAAAALEDVAGAECERFRRLRESMPRLFEEMKVDLQQPDHQFVREFFVSPSRRVIINSPGPRFFYYEDEHENLIGQVHVLEGNGYFVDVTPGNVPIYRMTERFVELLLNA
jgi:hypothetical protein